MTRRTFQRWVRAIAGVYAIAILAGLVSIRSNEAFDLYKALIPLLTALPAAMLAALFQRRASFLQQLRAVWAGVLDAVQEAIQYTHKESPSQPEYALAMRKLSYVIDDFRSLYRNLREGPSDRGYFPFESLKEIQTVIGQLGFGQSISAEGRVAARDRIVSLWKQGRLPILEEFDRSEATYYDTPFAKGHGMAGA